MDEALFNRELSRAMAMGKLNPGQEDYWLGYQSQCWGAKLLVGVEDDAMRVMVGVNLLGLGDFGTKQKFGD